MKLSSTMILLTFCLFLNTLSPAQVAPDREQDYSKFLVEPAKPYAYLEVDHVGPRKPLLSEEPKTGIWLHLRNNCKLPIVVLAIGDHYEYPKESIALEDEIVPEAIAPASRGDGDSGGVAAPPGLGEMLDLFRWRNMTEEEVRHARRGSGQQVALWNALGVTEARMGSTRSCSHQLPLETSFTSACLRTT